MILPNHKLASQIVDNLTTAILCFNSELYLTTMNPSAELLFDISAKQAIGLAVDEIMPPPAHHWRTILQRVLNQRQMFTERGLRLLLNANENRTVTVDCTITAIMQYEEVRYVLVELTQLDQHLRLNREETLFQQQEAVQNMVRGLVHEIKNPLGGLRGAAQLLSKALPDSDMREYTDIIIGEADRLQNLLNTILLPSRKAHKKYTNIHQLIIRVCQVIKSEHQQQNLEIDYDFDPSIPELWVDPDHIIQALFNIVRNAAQATATIELIPKIQIRTRIRRHLPLGMKSYKLVASIEVKDNGVGIPAHLINQIFFPLVTTRAEGTGLGLSIAQSLVNQQGGIIECSSIVGETIFTILLPATVASHEN